MPHNLIFMTGATGVLGQELGRVSEEQRMPRLQRQAVVERDEDRRL